MKEKKMRKYDYKYTNERPGEGKKWFDYYSTEKWEIKSFKCRALTRHHCIIFWWLKANHAHHMHYKNFEYEQPFRDIVPLSNFAHKIIHWSPLWGARKKGYKPRIFVNWFLRFMFALCVIFMFPFGKIFPRINRYKGYARKKIDALPKTKTSSFDDNELLADIFRINNEK